MSWTAGFEHMLRENEPLASYTWLRLGGPARYFAEPTSRDELLSLVKRAAEQGVPARLLGGGSNLLISDAGFPGLVIRLGVETFGKIERQGNQLLVGGGAKLGHLVSIAAREGLAGLEELVGIPGTVGGALHGNAGSLHGDIGAWTDSALLMTRTGEIIKRGRSEMHFYYRSSSLDELIILEAQFALEPGNPTEITKRMQKNWIVKRATSPASALAQGCMFKDPGGMSAASIIDQLGLKGIRIGDVQLSERCPNFVIVGQSGTSADVRELIDIVRRTVMDRLGVDLEPGMEMW
jgi:UDP-N-acetylmuramate dehydrogenase